eukprot:959553_1
MPYMPPVTPYQYQRASISTIRAQHKAYDSCTLRKACKIGLFIKHGKRNQTEGNICQSARIQECKDSIYYDRSQLVPCKLMSQLFRPGNNVINEWMMQSNNAKGLYFCEGVSIIANKGAMPQE